MYKERIENVQNYLRANNLDAYIVFSSDFHGSEYILDYFKVRAYLSGFTGSAGTLLITKENSYLWTDGRYFLQASKQLEDSKAVLMKMGEKDVPTILEFIKQENLHNIMLNFKVISSYFYQELNAIDGVKLVSEKPNFMKKIWPDRPALPKDKLWLIPDKQAGESASEKLNRLRKALKEHKAKYALIASLDDIAWLYNIRGNDILYNPVALAYSIVSEDKAILYINKKKVTRKVLAYFEANDIELKNYDDIYDDAVNLDDKTTIDPNKTNMALALSLKEKEEVSPFPTTMFKAIKNEVEIKNIRKAHLKDGVAMCKFMYHLKTCKDLSIYDEVSIADYLENLRREQGAFELSFGSIVGYQDHGAIIHYSANKESAYKLASVGSLLVDSGGQYKYGTTDITRTFALGKISEEFKHDFTLVLKSHIALAKATFKEGKRSDIELDKITRAPMKKENKDFNHGTGHGVGYVLNVHEGPHSISFKKKIPTIMQEGMVVTDEPGYYLEGKYGIRHENELLVVKARNNLKFEILTYVPFDLDAINVDELSKTEKAFLNRYHKMVYRRIHKYLTDEEANFLKGACREI